MTPPRVRAASAVVLLGIVITLSVWAVPPPAASANENSKRYDKVVVLGVPAIVWKDLQGARLDNLGKLIREGAGANMSVRISNLAAEGYAAIGAGQRVAIDTTGAFSFGDDEQVEHGTGADLYKRRNGKMPKGEISFSALEPVIRNNYRKAFDATPGLLGQRLNENGSCAAVVGNADHSLEPLPSVLPTSAEMTRKPLVETGVHREAVLAAMRADGTVPYGRVDRGLLVPDGSAPFGVSYSQEALRTSFSDAVSACDLVIVEMGDSARADAYSLGLGKEVRQRYRRMGLALTDRNVGSILEVLRGTNALVIVVAPTTPGGPEERGQLRPLIMWGKGIEPGLLTSSSTRREGLVAITDVTSTISKALSGEERLGAGRPMVLSRSMESSRWIPRLVDANTKAITHDRLRAPISISIVALTLVVYVIALRRLLKSKPLGWVSVLLAASLAFPVASFVSHAGIWRVGAFASGLLVVAVALGCAAAAVGIAGPYRGTAILLGATSALFVIDVIVGAPLQLDSIFGYTSVASGRFFGLGNLGFALFSGATFLLAGMLADVPNRRIRIFALVIPGLAAIIVGHPALGNDVGGTLAMVPATIVFVFTVQRAAGIQARWWPLMMLGSVALLMVFGLIDLARPPGQRTHLGEFLAQVGADPLTLWIVIKRKFGLAISLAISSRWGLAAPGAVAVLLLLHHRSKGSWRALMQNRRGLKAGLDALIVAAVIGSLVNDSGVAIAGTMLTIAAPWALLMAGNARDDAKAQSAVAG